MDRYQLVWHQCFDAPASGLVKAWGLDLGRPAAWDVVAQLWRGVQSELGWPAPAIAVNGLDGYQLWMSLAQPLPEAQAREVVAALCQRFWPDLPPARLQCSFAGPQVPRLDEARSVWSAWVAPDLAPVFEDAPWLDLPPNLDGQDRKSTRLNSSH